MIYKLAKRINPIHRVFVDESTQNICLWKYFENRSGLSVLDENLNETEIINENDNIRFSDIKPSKNYYWCNTGVGGIFRISKKNNRLVKEEFVVACFLSNDLVLIKRTEGKKKFLCCYDEKKEKTIWKQNFSSSRIFVSSSRLFCVPVYSRTPSNNTILALEPNTGDILWRHEEDFSEVIEFKKRTFPSKINRIIGVYKNTLWLGVNKDVLVGLDISTGEELYREQIGSDSDSLYAVTNMYLDEKKGVIIGLGGTHYWEIDLITKELINWELEDEFLPKKLRCMFNPPLYLMGKCIFFMSKDILPNDLSDIWQIAIFNRTTKKIEWNYTFNLEEGSFLTSFTATENGLFAIDWNKNLYVFKKGS